MLSSVVSEFNTESKPNQENQNDLLLLYLVGDASWFNLYIPLSVGHPGIIRKYCELLLSNEIVQTILECI